MKRAAFSFLVAGLLLTANTAMGAADKADSITPDSIAASVTQARGNSWGNANCSSSSSNRAGR